MNYYKRGRPLIDLKGKRPGSKRRRRWMASVNSVKSQGIECIDHIQIMNPTRDTKMLKGWRPTEIGSRGKLKNGLEHKRRRKYVLGLRCRERVVKVQKRKRKVIDKAKIH